MSSDDYPDDPWRETISRCQDCGNEFEFGDWGWGERECVDCGGYTYEVPL